MNMPWLRLIRVPNLFTVPGDPLAGGLLAAATLATVPNWANLAMAAAASVMLYAAGLIDNDLADFKEDRRDRPNRPLPSGQIKPAQAIAAAVAALAIGFGFAAMIGPICLAVAGVLVVCILLYNHLLKHVPLIGPIVMGLCRGLSVMLGAASLGSGGATAVPAVLAAGLIALYIAAVTGIAAGETSGKPVGRRRNLPAMVLAFFFTFVLSAVYESSQSVSAWAFIGLAGLSVVWSGVAAIRLGGTPAPAVVQKTIGQFIRNLLVIQAAFCCLMPPQGLIVAAVLVACWPIAAIVGRRFYAS